MDELARFACCGNEVVPAPRHMSVWKAENAVGERIAVVMIVEEPAVEALVAERGLNGVELHFEILQGRIADLTPLPIKVCKVRIDKGLSLDLFSWKIAPLLGQRLFQG